MASYHVQTLANSIIGTAILAMPYCFAKCGVILSILLLIISTFVTRSCCRYLIKASIVTRRRKMEQLGFHMFGNAGKTMVEISVIGFLMGTCIAFYVVIGDLSPMIVSKVFNIQSFSHDSVRKFLIILITITCVIPLSFQKSIESLSFVCRASIGFYICLTLKTVFESFERFENDPNWASNIDLWKPSGILQCIPIFSMAMSCQMQLFEVYETIGFGYDRIKKTVHQATTICCLVYCIVGFFGYLAFYNQNLSGNVLTSFSPSMANDAIKFGFILSVACSFPLVIFPCRTALASFLHPKGHQAEIAAYVPESKYQPLTLFIIFTTMILGILIPSVEVIISLVGSTIGVLVCVIFPATCFVKIMQRNSTEKTIAQVIIVAGFVIMILGTYANLLAIDTAKSGSHLEEKESIVESLVEAPKGAPDKEEEIVDDNKLVIEKEIDEAVKKKGEEEEMVALEEKISDDGIKKEEFEIAADKTIASKDPRVEIQEKNEEIQELRDSKDKLEKEVLEMKEVLVKQNMETQQLVLQKFDEIAEKVEKIEKQSAPGAKDKAIEDAQKIVDGEKVVEKVADEKPAEAAEKLLEVAEKLLVDVEKPKDLLPETLLTKEVIFVAPQSNTSRDVKKVEAVPVESKPEKTDFKHEPETHKHALEDHLENEHKLKEHKHELKAHSGVRQEPEAHPNDKREAKLEPKEHKLEKPENLEDAEPHVEKSANQETRVDPIVKLIKSQEPLSYQVGEKMSESKKGNTTNLDLTKLVKQESSEAKNEMRRKRDTFDDALSSLDQTLQNFELKSMISRDLKAIDDDEV